MAEKLVFSLSGIKDSLISNAPRILITVLILMILHFVIRFFMRRLSAFLINRISKTEGMVTEREERVQTISGIFTHIAFIIF